MSRVKQIEEMAHDLCRRYQDGICVVDGKPCNLDLDCTCQINATTLYNADYRKQSGWISVEEMLPPDKHGVYIVALEDSRFENFVYFDVRPYAYGKWSNIPDKLTVTHWMPLPEPPKGDRHEM